MATEHHGSARSRHHYGQLAMMAALSFAAMYLLTYAMVDVLGNVYNNVNQVYMAGLMTAPMIPHHASALLKCEESPITDPEIQTLCKTIISGQQAEIDQMKAASGTPASALRKRCCQRSSTCSRWENARSNALAEGSGWGSRWFATWSACTAEPSTFAATVRDRAANSPCVFRSIRARNP
jgi:hypothetical protein